MKALKKGPGNGVLDEPTIRQQFSYWLVQYREMKGLERSVPDRQDLDSDIRTRVSVHYEQKKRGFEPPSPMELFSP